MFRLIVDVLAYLSNMHTMRYIVLPVLLSLNIFKTLCKEVMSNFQTSEITAENINCRGRLYTDVCFSTCVAICHSSSAELYLLGRTPDDVSEDCDCFIFKQNEIGDNGNCTLCFSTSKSPDTVPMAQDGSSSMVYFKSSDDCEYLIFLIYIIFK